RVQRQEHEKIALPQLLRSDLQEGGGLEARIDSAKLKLYQFEAVHERIGGMRLVEHEQGARAHPFARRRPYRDACCGQRERQCEPKKEQEASHGLAGTGASV